jgi:hypothetical protein
MNIITLSASDMVESAMLGWALLVVDHVCLVKGLEHCEYLYEYVSRSTASHENGSGREKMFDQKIGFLVKSAAI